MAGRVEGKVALITGAARGQGRAHTIRLAEEGADVVVFDICSAVEHRASTPASTPEDLAETVRLVEATGRRGLGMVGDVRDLAALEAAVAEGVAAFGKIDILVANAGVAPSNARLEEIREPEFDTVLGVNVKGTWLTVKAVLPHMIARRSGSVILVASTGALMGMSNIGDYIASKHAVLGLMRTFANENGRHEIRVNALCPGAVNTPMFVNPSSMKLFRPDLDDPGLEDIMGGLEGLSLFPSKGLLDPVDLAHAVLWLASDEARWVTGVALPVDMGTLVKR